MAQDAPIIVTDSTLEGQVGTLVRYLVAAGGAFALGQGWIDDPTLQALTGLATIAVPIGLGMWKTYRNKGVTIVAAEAAPNAVVKVIHK